MVLAHPIKIDSFILKFMYYNVTKRKSKSSLFYRINEIEKKFQEKKMK